MDKLNITESDFKLAEFLKALGNPVRLSILKILMDKGSCPHGCHPCSCGDKCEGENCKCGCKCGELVDSLPISQPTVSQHIKELKKIGLLETRGRKGDYVINYNCLKDGLESLLLLTGYRSAEEIVNEKCCLS